jgi:hypothetical protein
MGTHFFAGKAPNIGTPGEIGLASRAAGAASGAARGASIGAQKDIGAAAGINKAAAYKPSQRSAAYAPGPKKT